MFLYAAEVTSGNNNSVEKCSPLALKGLAFVLFLLDISSFKNQGDCVSQLQTAKHTRE
jgi:hypothetical protein